MAYIAQRLRNSQAPAATRLSKSSARSSNARWVWNGSAYEYINWDAPTSYNSVYKNKPYMSLSTCQA